MEPVPTLVKRPRPRALTAAEHGLVSRLVAFVDVEHLGVQVMTAVVASACDCGCGSVGLRSAGPPVPATVVARLSSTGRDDYFAVSASGRDGLGIVLHVAGGMLTELEIFAGPAVTVTAPAADGLTDVWIS